MTVGVHDGLRWVGTGQAPAAGLTVSVVFGATVEGEVGRLVDERSGPGVGADVGGSPEGTTEVDLSEIIGI